MANILTKYSLAMPLAALLLVAGCREVPFQTQILTYEGNKVAGTFPFEGGSLQSDEAGAWTVDVSKTKVDAIATDYTLSFKMKDGEIASGGAAVQFEFDNWCTQNYIFAPSHLYNGNRFRIFPIGYTPFLHNKEDRPLNIPVTTTNVPHLNRDGSDSYVDFKTNSCSTPLTGFYDYTAKRGFFILTEQDTVLGNEAFFISEYPSEGRLTIRLSAPGVREHRYVMCHSDFPSNDEGIALRKGDEIKMHFRVYDFDCEDLPAYFDKFLTIRKDLSGQNEYRNLEPFSSIDSTVLAHNFRTKWYEDENVGYICNKPDYPWPVGHLQLGWNGAPVYSLMQLARPELQPDYAEILRRVSRTFDSITMMQGESGIFYGMMRHGKLSGDNFEAAQKEPDVAMIRRTTITVYYGLQCLDMLRLQGHGDMIKPEWESMLRKAATGLCRLFDRYGEFGQFVHADTGEIHTPNSTASALAMGALAYASRYFDNPEFLEYAVKSGDYYYENHLAKGYVGGGPGEILQAPDSESSGEITASYTALYEITRDAKWLKYARDAAAFLSSWVVSYDYQFPSDSNFGEHGIKATGSVWASVQNEHSAPGLYVMSSDFLLKLYRATGDSRYIELCRDMSHNVAQYVNTEGNRLQSEGGFGYASERVNLGDWEGNEGIGNIPQNDSNLAWENVAMINTTEVPGIYVQPDKGTLTVFDHVDARIVSSDADNVTLEITNPTYRPGDVTVLAEDSKYAGENSLGWLSFYSWPKVHVGAGQTVTVTLNTIK